MAMLSYSSEGIWVRAMRERNFAAILDWFTTYFFGAGIAILLVIDLVAWVDSGGSFSPMARAASGGLLLAAASVVAGWLLGLLFGIPRSLSRPQPAAGRAPGSGSDGTSSTTSDVPRPSRTNTNLEDVSDWLTKTIVGLGLANLYLIPGYAWRKSGQIGAQIFASSSGQSLVLLIATYFAIGGFWIGYIGTRTMITLLFDVVDRSFDSKAVADAADPANLQLDPTSGTIKPATDGLLEADQQLLGRPLQSMSSPTELAAWGAAKARSGEWGTALAILAEAAKSAPGDAAIKKLLSTVSAANKPPDP